MTRWMSRSMLSAVLCGATMLVAAACSSTKVTERERYVNEPLARPATIFVYDFAATPADVPADSLLTRNFAIDKEPQTPEDVAAAKALGSQIAKSLAAQINEMGMTAVHVTGPITPQVDDMVIRGYLVSVDEGSKAKRVTIGFGSGASELQTAVEGLQMTENGLRHLGYGKVQAGSNKTPGAAAGAVAFAATANPVGLIVSSGTKIAGERSGRATIQGRAAATAKEIANQLEARFKEEGWI